MSKINSTNTICENIFELNKRQQLIKEQKRLSYEFLAKEFIETSTAAKSIENLLSQYADIVGKTEDAALVNFFCSIIDKIEVSQLLSENSDIDLKVFSRSDSAKISYVKNNHSDTAFDKFSTLFENPKVSYNATFEDICEDVYNSICDYCILPIESAGGKLFSFYSLIDKYDLKIFAVCDLEDGISDKHTRYALLTRKNIYFSEPIQSSYFEFSMTVDNNYSLKNILDAAECCGLNLYRLDTMSVPYDDMTFRFYHIFKSDSANALPFIMYLNYKYPQHDSIGYYISLK